MKIVTGMGSEAHITSNDHQGFNQGLCGSGAYILDVGNKLSTELRDNNTLRIYDGEAMIQGVHFRVLPGSYDEVTLSNGSSGVNRIDLVVARYEKNASTQQESISWVVKEGTAVSGTPSDPAYTSGNIRAGDAVAEMPFFRILYTGLNVTSVTRIVDVVPNIGKANDLVKKDGIKYTNLTVSAPSGGGVTFAQNANHIYLRRSGNFVEAIFGIHCELGAANTVYTLTGNIPSGYRPIDNQRIFAGTESSNKLVGSGTAYDVTTTGAVKIHSPSIAMYQRRCTAVWMTSDAWPA